jgi:hypothetical protein
MDGYKFNFRKPSRSRLEHLIQNPRDKVSESDRSGEFDCRPVLLSGLTENCPRHDQDQISEFTWIAVEFAIFPFASSILNLHKNYTSNYLWTRTHSDRMISSNSIPFTEKFSQQ